MQHLSLTTHPVQRIQQAMQRTNMAAKIIRGAIIGASTLLGKELAEELTGATFAAWVLTLLDTEESGGTITAAGDEPHVIQPISALAFAGIDVAFFAGKVSTTLEFWKAAHAAGACIVDLTGALEGQPNVLVGSPLVEGGASPDLATIAEVSAHPAAIMLALISARLQRLGLTRMAATVLQPASELGSAGVEEVHQQTVGLLSFKPLKKDIYDTQVAFNVVASLGSDAKLNLDTARARIHRHIAALSSSDAADSIALQLLQAPVFHGYTASVFVELSHAADAESIRAVMLGSEPAIFEEESPSNESAAGKGEVLFSITPTISHPSNTFWLWIASDNLRLAARNATACALELLDLKPKSLIQ
jgi:aspartate-semialdehyde dehydrogenase